MVLSGSDHVTSYDPDTGKKLWEIDGPTEQFVASFVYHDGLFFMTGGFPERHVLTYDSFMAAWRAATGARAGPAGGDSSPLVRLLCGDT